MSRRLLLVSNDHIGREMAGPGIRYYEFARELSKRFEVTLVVPDETDAELGGIGTLHIRPDDEFRLGKLVRSFDAVIAQRLPVPTMALLARSNTRVIYDLYAPTVLELLALEVDHFDSAVRRLQRRRSTLIQQVALGTGDAFVCASERQRDMWLGALAAAGRLDRQRYGADPSLRSFIDVVPFGIPSAPPRARGPVVKGVVAGIRESDKLLLWGGGIWNWLDPLTVIRAVARLAERRDDIRLYFLGIRRPNPDVAEMEMTQRAVDLADELDLRDRCVFFNVGWVPYAERGAYLLEADVGVSAHFDNLETRFAFRTRLVDCLWAGLPMVVTRGDALAEHVAAHGLGSVVDFGDVQGWADAIEALVDNETKYQRAQVSIEAVRPEFSWPRVIEPLARLVEAETPRGRARRSARLELAVTESIVESIVNRVRLSIAYRGVRGATRRVLTRIVRQGRGTT
jgi:glycosyltransferase involved in cell wall biosynthesis